MGCQRHIGLLSMEVLISRPSPMVETQSLSHGRFGRTVQGFCFSFLLPFSQFSFIFLKMFSDHKNQNFYTAEYFKNIVEKRKQSSQISSYRSVYILICMFTFLSGLLTYTRKCLCICACVYLYTHTHTLKFYVLLYFPI